MTRPAGDQPPPFSEDAERSVIAAILIAEDGMERVAAYLSSSDFYTSLGRNVYAAMEALHAAGRPVDDVTVPERLRQNACWAPDTEAELAAAAARVPSAASLEEYAGIVVNYSRRRDGLRLARQLEEALRTGNPDEIAQLRTALEGSLAAVGDSALSSSLPIGMGWEERIRRAFRTAPELAEEGGAETEWLVRNWIAKGTRTAIDGLPKGGGKTTFVLRLVAAVLAGKPFLGEPCRRTKVVYLTEEPRASFLAGLRRAGLADHADLYVLPRHRVMGAPWTEIVKAALAFCEAVGAGLLIIDTFPPFAGLRGDDENSAGAILAAMDPLEAAVTADIAVILTRHERKSQGEPGVSGRGSNALTGAVETVFTIRRPRSQSNPCVRELTSLSRFDEIPAAVSIELTSAGFVVVGTGKPDDDLAALRRVLPGSEAAAMTAAEVAAAVGKAKSTAYRGLGRLYESGEVRRTGAGGKGDPFRFWAPGAPTVHSSHPTSYREEKKEERGEGQL